MTIEQTVRQLVEALELHGKQYPHMVKGYCVDAIAAGRTALAQMAAPVAAAVAPGLRQRIEQLIEQHGSLRAAARVLMVDVGYLSRLASGEKDDPGEDLLRRMKLRRVVSYESTAAPATQAAKPSEAAPRTILDVTLTLGEADYIAAFLDDDAEKDDDVVRLMVGDGHSGHGLYAAHPDYPDEGAVLVKAIDAQIKEQQP